MINKIILSIFFTLTFAVNIMGQSSFKEINTQSLKHYNTATWDSVIYYGKVAAKNDIDYYYLNYRLAVAYFYTADYYTSTYYFDKCINQNELALSDLFFIDLYYRALLYTKQYCLTDRLFTNTKSADSLINVKHRGSFYLSYINGNIINLIDESDLRKDEEKVYSQTDYQQTINTIGIGGYFIASRNIEIDFRYSYSDIDMISAAENSMYFDIKNYKLNQHIVNLKPRIHINAKSSIDFAFGFHRVEGSPYGLHDSTLVIEEFNYKTTNLMAGFSYNYLYKNMRFGANFVYSNFLERKNLQFGASLQWFPKGNLNLYSITEISAFKSDNDMLKPVIYQKVGGKIYNKLWLEGSVIIGNVQNFTMLSSNYTFETSYKTKALFGGRLIYVLNPSINFYVGPQYILSTMEQYQDIPEEEESNGGQNRGRDRVNNSNNNLIDYSHFNIAGGIQWKF